MTNKGPIPGGDMASERRRTMAHAEAAPHLRSTSHSRSGPHSEADAGVRTRLVGVLLVALLVLLPLLVMPSSSGAFVLRFAAEILLVGTAVMSLNVLIGFAGLVSLGHAAVFGVAAYCVAVAAQHWGADLIWVLPLGMAAGAALAAAMACVTTRSAGLFFLVLTLMTGQMTWEVVFRWREVTGGADGLRGFSALSAMGLPLASPWALYGVALAVAVASWAALRHFIASPLGISIQGMRDQPLRMRALGLSLPRLRLLAFTVTGTVAGAAGALYPFVNQYVGPNTVHWSMSATFVIMAVLGGIHTLAGAFVGAAVYLVAQNQISSYTDRWQLLIGLLFVAIVLFVPNGLLSAMRKGQRA